MTRGRLVIVVALGLFLLGSACSDEKKTATPSSSQPPISSGSASSSAGSTLRVLVSNDDGVGAPGIDALVEALRAEPDVDVTVVAPAENQSGTGGKTSPTPPPASNATTKSGYPAVAVEGFPADAVLHGLQNVVEERPHLVVSGVNSGQNIGPFIDVSGTVGAARAAAQRGVPALAVSAGLSDPVDFATAAGLAIDWVRQHRDALIASSAAPKSVANLNVPTCTTGKVRGEVEVSPDPSAPGDVALGPSDCTSTAVAPSTDVAAFIIGFATLSDIPLQPS